MPTVVELKAELRELGLKVSGKKSELIQRLDDARGSANGAPPAPSADASSPAALHPSTSGRKQASAPRRASGQATLTSFFQASQAPVTGAAVGGSVGAVRTYHEA